MYGYIMIQHLTTLFSGNSLNKYVNANIEIAKWINITRVPVL